MKCIVIVALNRGVIANVSVIIVGVVINIVSRHVMMRMNMKLHILHE